MQYLLHSFLILYQCVSHQEWMVHVNKMIELMPLRTYDSLLAASVTLLPEVSYIYI